MVELLTSDIYLYISLLIGQLLVLTFLVYLFICRLAGDNCSIHVHSWAKKWHILFLLKISKICHSLAHHVLACKFSNEFSKNILYFFQNFENFKKIIFWKCVIFSYTTVYDCRQQNFTFLWSVLNKFTIIENNENDSSSKSASNFMWQI